VPIPLDFSPTREVATTVGCAVLWRQRPFLLASLQRKMTMERRGGNVISSLPEERPSMSDDRIAKTIGVDDLLQSITTATLRALKSEQPELDIQKTGLIVSFRVYCGYPRVSGEFGGELETTAANKG
jgi:hypothetical protein